MAEPPVPAMPKQVICRDKGRFKTCPGQKPRTIDGSGARRKHRRKWDPNATCECPPGSTEVPSARGNKKACVMNTGEGARFVKQSCSARFEPPKRTYLTVPLEPGEPRASAPEKKPKRRPKIDWTKCKCPEGAVRAGRQCLARNAEGKRRFVAAICPDNMPATAPAEAAPASKGVAAPPPGSRILRDGVFKRAKP